jgi:ApaG protein
MTAKRFDIRVEPEATYSEEQSDVATDMYFFHYRIRIVNAGSEAAQLISRHWIIIDANDQVQEVRGMGVVGEQPRIEPGQVYEYTSGASLGTPYGSMHGSYHLLGDDGQRFEAEIPEMQLVAYRVLH